VITCTRCGKENQDHYKFCLGCGNEIKAAPKAEAKPASREPLPLETARTVLPPEGGAGAGGGFSANAHTPPPVAKSKGGIPWNDSPKMPTGMTGAKTGNIGMAGAVTPPPITNGPSGKAAPETTATDAPVAPWNQSRAVAGSLSNSAQVAGTTGTVAPVSAPPSAAGATTCPNCGRTINPGFAFCGACGTRISPPPGGAGAGVAAQKTMYMAAPTPAPSAVPRGRIILIRPDGSEGGAHPLHDGENLVGRGQGALFEGDLYLSPRHAEFVLGADGLLVRDLKSLNGVFVKIDAEEALESGDVIRVGQELLRFEIIAPPAPLEDGTEVAGTPNPGFWGRLSVIVGRDVDGSAFPLFGDAIVMGRERGDILFPEDGYVSGTHARITLRDGRVYLADVGSSNGTFLRVRGERKISPGGFILMGQQLFRTEYR
jgi:pSer/pThr/pTyr-binding forkhead associated (FHA) protein